jgi:2-phosphosulfolactate phosphatase
MSPHIYVHFLPSLLDPSALRGGVAVVIDVLRASTTIVHALANGAESVIPCEEVEAARATAANLPAGQVLLGGERQGVLIDGFDLDNSPSRYTPDVVAGKTIVFTTTNGTRALQRAATADRILVGAFVNINAIIGSLLAKPRPHIHLICAGTGGRITAEDCLFAGAVAAGILEQVDESAEIDDQARVAIDFFRARNRDRDTFLNAMFDSLGGKDLRKLGLAADIERAAVWNLFDTVPEYCSQSGRIQANRR